MNIKESLSERIFYIFVVLSMCGVIFVTLYPFIYVISMSISEPIYVAKQEVWIYPKGFSIGAYKMVFENPDVWISYYNTIWYTVVGTTINLILTIAGAYPLSKKTFRGRNFITMFIALTMFFSGGLIPSFLLIKQLGLYGTRWALILPGAISAYNLIIARTFFETMPESIQESAKLDGANDIRILFRIVLPLSMPIVAVLTLFYAVGHWNSYFAALLYLPNAKLQPLQLYLMKILIQNEQSLLQGLTDEFDRSIYAMQTKYAAIIVAVLPILCIYPFLQKYFVKGVMIGAIKE